MNEQEIKVVEESTEKVAEVAETLAKAKPKMTGKTVAGVVVLVLAGCFVAEKGYTVYKNTKAFVGKKIGDAKAKKAAEVIEEDYDDDDFFEEVEKEN